MELARLPFTGGARALLGANIAMAILLFATPIAFWPLLPDPVPAHFDLAGVADGYVDRPSALPLIILIAASLSLVNALIATFSIMRYGLLINHPYLVSIPAIIHVLSHPSLSPIQRGELVNRVFTVLLLEGVLLGATLLVIEFNILVGMLTHRLPISPVAVIPMAIAVVLVGVYLYRRTWLHIRRTVAVSGHGGVA